MPWVPEEYLRAMLVTLQRELQAARAEIQRLLVDNEELAAQLLERDEEALARGLGDWVMSLPEEVQDRVSPLWPEGVGREQ